jgi:hypothetical protein
MSKTYIISSILGVLVISLMALAACAPSSADASMSNPDLPVTVNTEPQNSVTSEVELTTVDEEGSTAIDADCLEEELAQISSGELSQEEIDGLLFMREEEKLAHDVYTKLYELWGLPIFENIASSEQTHTQAVLPLIIRYGLEDPAGSNEIGEFQSATLQDLYNQLISQGSQSLVDALKVGAAIEEIDILDLQENIDNTSHSDIIMVYENLMKGSRNHLRSFISTLEKQTGEAYLPQHLSLEEFESIIGTQIERGGAGNDQSRNSNQK